MFDIIAHFEVTQSAADDTLPYNYHLRCSAKTDGTL